MKPASGKRSLGAAAVALAYVMWGLLTLFWNLLDDVDPVFILSQRIIWSMVFMGLGILLTGGAAAVGAAFVNRHEFLICLACGVLVTINWGVYIYAVNSSHVLDASLGYFIEPVLVTLIGLIMFKEKPGTLEKITIAFAAAGLAFIIIRTRTVPYLSLLIAGSFAIYGALKKKIAMPPETSLFMETLLMTPLALGYVIFSLARGGDGVSVEGAEFLLLPACGIVTSVPLLLFNSGVKKIPYYLSGILMYINPTLQFLMGIFYFKEPIDRDRLIAFIIIWVGVMFTVAEKLIAWRKDTAHGKGN